MTSFYERLCNERERLGFDTQEQFADAIGVGRTTQGKYERGQRKPDAAYLERAAKLGMDVGYLFTGLRSLVVYDKDHKPRTLTVEESCLLDNYANASEQGRAAARAVLDAIAQPAPGGKRSGNGGK